ncbi:MAG: hypothetical protein ACYTDY_01680 [Planctomycetota bacterium]|jgi:hypothetical protein
MRRLFLLLAPLLILSHARAEEALLGRWNERDLSQFEVAGPGGWKAVDGRIRAVPLKSGTGYRTLRLPLTGTRVTRIVYRLSGGALGASIVFGTDRSDSAVLLGEIPTPYETTEVSVVLGEADLGAAVEGRSVAARSPDGPVRWVGVRVEARAGIAIRDVLWFGERRAPTPPEPKRVRKVTDARGTLEKDTSWTDDVHLVGDVVVPRGVTLRIRQGTRILPRLPEDGPSGSGSASFYDLRPDLAEIHVLGKIEAIGSPGSPVVFGEPGSHENWEEKGWNGQTWLGVIAHPGADAGSRFLRCVFTGALGGVLCADGKPRIESCLFDRCSLGVAAGTVWSDRKGRRIISSRYPAPRVERCRFVQCETGVYVDLRGRPAIERSVFLGCVVAVGRWRGGYSHPISGLGALIDRSDFLYNRTCVQGSSSVRNSIFFGNEQVFSSSRFHRRYGATIDRYHRTHNVYHGNQALANDDIPFGVGSRFEDPRYKGPIQNSRTMLLEEDATEVLSLATGSPALGAASDGGDPGSEGRQGGGERRGAEDVRLAGVALGPWLAPGPPSAAGSLRVESLPRMAGGSRPSEPQDLPQPAKRQGQIIWSLLPTTDGLLRLAMPHREGDRESALLLAGVRSDWKGSADLSVGLEGRVVRCVWNGRKLSAPENRRRFAHADLVFEVPVREGVNLLALEIVPDRPAARVSAVLAPRAPGGAEGWHYVFRPPPPRPEAAVKRVSATVGRSRRDRTGVVTVFLAARIHWLDATRPDSYRVTGPLGPIRFDASAVEYDPRDGKVRITGLPLERNTEYTVVVEPLRDCWGRTIEPGRAEWKAKTK